MRYIHPWKFLLEKGCSLPGPRNAVTTSVGTLLRKSWGGGYQRRSGLGPPDSIFTGSQAQNSAEKNWKREGPGLMSVKAVFKIPTAPILLV